MDDLLTRIRRLDPVPDPVLPPPIHRLLRELELEPAAGIRRLERTSEPGLRPSRSKAVAGLRHVPTILAAVISVAVAGIALVLVHRHANTGPATSPNGLGPSASGPPAFPHLSARERTQINYVMKAEGAVARSDSTCAPDPIARGGAGRTPSLSSGSPSAATLAVIGTLRRPATPQDRLPPRKLFDGPHSKPRIYPYGTYPAVTGIYSRFIRYARHRDGANFYLVPAANVNQQPHIPERCFREQVVALHHELPQIPRSRRAGIFTLQARLLAYQRASSVPYPGVCLVAINDTGNGDGASCYPMTYIKSGHTLSSGAPAGVPIVYGLAPDGVRTVSFYYRGRNPQHGLAATVIDNVFILHNPRDRLPDDGFPARLIWRSPEGHPVKTITWR